MHLLRCALLHVLACSSCAGLRPASIRLEKTPLRCYDGVTSTTGPVFSADDLPEGQVLRPAQAMKGLYAAFNARDAEAVASFLTDDCVYEDLLLGPATVCRGKEAFMNALQFHPAFVSIGCWRACRSTSCPADARDRLRGGGRRHRRRGVHCSRQQRFLLGLVGVGLVFGLDGALTLTLTLSLTCRWAATLSAGARPLAGEDAQRRARSSNRRHRPRHRGANPTTTPTPTPTSSHPQPQPNSSPGPSPNFNPNPNRARSPGPSEPEPEPRAEPGPVARDRPARSPAHPALPVPAGQVDPPGLGWSSGSGCPVGLGFGWAQLGLRLSWG